MVDQAVVEELAARFTAVAPQFDGAAFVADLMAALPDLELKARMEAIARRIAAELGADYRNALASLVAVAKAEPPIAGFAAWPLATYVELFGVDDPAASLPAMEHITKRMSCEFAIRPFLREHWEAAYAQLVAFTSHGDPAVRRLASEGPRPRLPWGGRVARLVDDPRPGLALVTRLRHDPSEDVRRSVANHLNDVAKDRPDLVIDTVAPWLDERPPVDRKMIAHALRSLVKSGNPRALAVLGFTTSAAIDIIAFDVAPPRVELGDRIELTATLRSTADTAQRLVVDFLIHHPTASGGTSSKVFKWTVLDLEPGAEITLTKRRQIVNASTRTYSAGRHTVVLQVAGSVVAEASFDVVV
jgi:3-methyladenine DNA glycosylase AlkC